MIFLKTGCMVFRHSIASLFCLLNWANVASLTTKFAPDFLFFFPRGLTLEHGSPFLYDIEGRQGMLANKRSISRVIPFIRNIPAIFILLEANAERDPRFNRRLRRVKRSGPRSCSAIQLLCLHAFATSYANRLVAISMRCKPIRHKAAVALMRTLS